jgi:hypothetical protein
MRIVDQMVKGKGEVKANRKVKEKGKVKAKGKVKVNRKVKVNKKVKAQAKVKVNTEVNTKIKAKACLHMMHDKLRPCLLLVLVQVVRFHSKHRAPSPKPPPPAINNKHKCPTIPKPSRLPRSLFNPTPPNNSLTHSHFQTP